MKNGSVVAVLAIFLLSAFVSCEKDTICSPSVSGPAVITTQGPANTPTCCSHRHYSSNEIWYYCCRCGILHAAGSGVGGAFYPGEVLSGATVEYIAPDDVVVATLCTDSEGHWAQDSVPDGTYTVRFTLTGYKTVLVLDVDMEDGATDSDMSVAMEVE